MLAAVLGKSSRRLLAFAVQRKWVAATRTLLSSVAADQPAEEAMAAIDVMCVGTTGMPLLQLAVRSQQLELVQAVLEWGDAHGEGCRVHPAPPQRTTRAAASWVDRGFDNLHRAAARQAAPLERSLPFLAAHGHPCLLPPGPQATPSSPPPPAAAA